MLVHGSGASRAIGIVAGMGYSARGAAKAAPLLRKDLAIMLDVAATAGVPTGALADVAELALHIMTEPL